MAKTPRKRDTGCAVFLALLMIGTVVLAMMVAAGAASGGISLPGSGGP